LVGPALYPSLNVALDLNCREWRVNPAQEYENKSDDSVEKDQSESRPDDDAFENWVLPSAARFLSALYRTSHS